MRAIAAACASTASTTGSTVSAGSTVTPDESMRSLAAGITGALVTAGDDGRRLRFFLDTAISSAALAAGELCCKFGGRCGRRTAGRER